MNYAVILIGDPPEQEDSLAQAVRAFRREGAVAEAAALHGSPALEDALGACLEEGAGRVVVIPFLLQMEKRLYSALSERIAALQKAYPDAELTLASPVGFDPRLVEIARNRAESTLAELDGNAGVPILNIEGRVSDPKSFTYQNFRHLPGQIPDVGRVVPGRRGTGVWLRALLQPAGPDPGATHAVFHASKDGFSARVALDEAVERGLLVYQVDGQPLPAGQGGPLRLFVPGGDDRCANVKNVVRLEIV